jgi:RNA polymerase sigma factor (sigma-70 family)
MSSTAAAEALCRRLWPRLVGSMTLYCGDRGVAEEIAQEALGRVWASWPVVHTMASPEAWAYRVATNLANSWYRRRRAERRALRRAGPARAADEDDATERLAVRAAVARLPERQRMALVMRYYADLPVGDVAVLMGCAPATVRAHTFKAIEALRRHGLADIEEEPEHVNP